MVVTQQDYALWVEQDQTQLHPIQNAARHTNPLVIERAEGVYLYTTDGRKILDGMAGLWNVNIGYGNTELPDAARDQMLRLPFTSNFAGMTNVPSIQLAQKLSGYAYPNLKTTSFTSGGSESNESAFKTARFYWKRLGKPEKTKIIARNAAYHGISMGATSATGIARYHSMFGPLIPGFLHIPNPNPHRYEGDIRDGESVGQAAARALEEAILREGPETVAAFIAEPIQGVGGVIVPPDDYFPLIRAICDQYEVLFISDEVITGFGRTGKMFGLTHWGVQPDILTFAKGVTSGYIPLGGMQITDTIKDTIWNAPDAESWMHGYTYSGHATACAVGLKNIEILERDHLPERSAVLGERLLQGLEGLTEFPQVYVARGKGLLAAIEIVQDKTSRTPDLPMANKIAGAAMAAGLRTRVVGNALAFSPPLSISEAEVDWIVQTMGTVLADLQG
jgi:adenosylmethionine-8-amino-7-oxononanoate aminotransferase